MTLTAGSYFLEGKGTTTTVTEVTDMTATDLPNTEAQCPAVLLTLRSTQTKKSIPEHIGVLHATVVVLHLSMAAACRAQLVGTPSSNEADVA